MFGERQRGARTSRYNIRFKKHRNELHVVHSGRHVQSSQLHHFLLRLRNQLPLPFNDLSVAAIPAHGEGKKDRNQCRKLLYTRCYDSCKRFPATIPEVFGRNVL